MCDMDLGIVQAVKDALVGFFVSAEQEHTKEPPKWYTAFVASLKHKLHGRDSYRQWLISLLYSSLYQLSLWWPYGNIMRWLNWFIWFRKRFANIHKCSESNIVENVCLCILIHKLYSTPVLRFYNTSFQTLYVDFINYRILTLLILPKEPCKIFFGTKIWQK